MNNIIINKQLLHLVISIIAAAIFYSIMKLLFKQTHFGFFRVFSGDEIESVSSIVKIIIYIAFCYGTLDVFEKRKKLRYEFQAFGLNLLPIQEQLVLSPSQVETIKLDILQRQKNGQEYILLDLIKKSATQFRNEQNITDTLHVLDSQLNATQDNFEGDLEISRYIIQAIPTFGFVGTIVEMTAALAYIKDIEKENIISKIGEAMKCAFDATVVALIASMIFTFLYHQYIGEVDVFFARAKSNIVDNLISRIYKGK